MGSVIEIIKDAGAWFEDQQRVWEERGFQGKDSLSHHEDAVNDRLVFLPSFREAISGVLDAHVDKSALQIALEVGCGTGFFSRYLAPDWLKEKLVSFDISQLSLGVLKEKDEDANVFQGSIYSLPVSDQSVDVVIGYSSFDSFALLVRALNEAKRVLKPGGKIVLFQDVTTELYETNGTLEDKRASFERYHEALVEAMKITGIPILEGEKDYLRICNTESMSQIRQRVPDFELLDRQYPLLAIWNRGYVFPTTNTRTRQMTGVTREAVMEDQERAYKKFSEGGLPEEIQGLNPKAGDLITSLTMRFLVGQKSA